MQEMGAGYSVVIIEPKRIKHRGFSVQKMRVRTKGIRKTKRYSI